MANKPRPKDLWHKDGALTAEVYRSSETSGSRYSMLGRFTCYNVRGPHFGIGGWATRADAHAFLLSKGYTKVTNKEVK